MLNKEVQEQLIAIIKQRLNPDFIILFGSFAKGTTHDESDIDLAYFSEQQLSPYERFILAGELAEIAKCEVDVIDIKKIDTVFTMQIFEKGIPIYIKNENEFTRQRMRAYSMYATLSEQRAPKFLPFKNEEVYLAMNDVILNKTTTIERFTQYRCTCLSSIRIGHITSYIRKAYR